jgi:hypothetical protein
MADLIIKPSAVADSFKMNDANSSANTILTIEGQTDSGVTTAGRIIYGKGVNETKGTHSEASNVVTLDLATGTFFDVTMSAAVTSWKILHIPAANTVAAWVLKLTNHSTAAANTWTGHASSTYDNGSAFVSVSSAPLFHWAAGTAHIITATDNATDIVTFWTFGGATPVIYSSVNGQNFAT